MSSTIGLYAGMRWPWQGNPLPRVLRKALRAQRFWIRPQTDSHLDEWRPCPLIVSASRWFPRVISFWNTVRNTIGKSLLSGKLWWLIAILIIDLLLWLEFSFNTRVIVWKVNYRNGLLNMASWFMCRNKPLLFSIILFIHAFARKKSIER